MRDGVSYQEIHTDVHGARGPLPALGRLGDDVHVRVAVGVRACGHVRLRGGAGGESRKERRTARQTGKCERAASPRGGYVGAPCALLVTFQQCEIILKFNVTKNTWT